MENVTVLVLFLCMYKWEYDVEYKKELRDLYFAFYKPA